MIFLWKLQNKQKNIIMHVAVFKLKVASTTHIKFMRHYTQGCIAYSLVTYCHLLSLIATYCLLLLFISLTPHLLLISFSNSQLVIATLCIGLSPTKWQRLTSMMPKFLLGQRVREFSLNIKVLSYLLSPSFADFPSVRVLILIFTIYDSSLCIAVIIYWW